MDLPGEKLIIKLWETLAEKGIGSLLSPWHARREGRTRNEIRREEILMLAQAERDAADVRSGRKQFRPDGTLAELPALDSDATLTTFEDGRIEPTLSLPTAMVAANMTAAVNAARMEINSSKAILYAEEQLENDQQAPSDRAIDEDWLIAWRDCAGRVSSEDLQRLWGSVLASEVKSPGSHSLRTLEFLKTLSKAEAELISKLASFVVDGRIVRSQETYLDSQGVNFGLLLRLQEMGVLSGVEAVGLTTNYKTASSGRFLKGLISHSKILLVEHEDESKVLSLEVYTLTEVGMQLMGLGSFEPDLAYLRSIGKGIAAQGFRVQLCDWQQTSETKGQYSNAERIEA